MTSPAPLPVKVARITFGILFAGVVPAVALELRYLWPTAGYVATHHAWPIAAFITALYVNLFALGLWIARRSHNAETGRMLSRVDAPMRDTFSGPVVQ